MHNANWDDLRYVLAVAELGSVSAAARHLGVNHATVLRRISAFEDAHEATIFERGPQGYRLRPESVPLIEAARDAAQAMDRVGEVLDGAGAPERRAIRITSVDTLVGPVLAPGLPALEKAMAPRLVSLMTSNARLDMGRLQADIAVRPAPSLPAELSGTEVAQLGFAAYARAPEVDRWLGLSGPLSGSAPARWMRDNVAREAVVAYGDSFPVLRDMAISGGGRVYLPRILGDAAASLIRLPEDQAPLFSVPIWVAVHCDLDDAQWLIAPRRAVERVLRQAKDRLSGL